MTTFHLLHLIFSLKAATLLINLMHSWMTMKFKMRKVKSLSQIAKEKVVVKCGKQARGMQKWQNQIALHIEPDLCAELKMQMRHSEEARDIWRDFHCVS